MKKICVYTCITGDYDDLKEIEFPNDNVDYICFTNNKNVKSNTWHIINISDDELDNTRLARKIKILGNDYINENYDISIWIDAAMTFKISPIDYVYNICQIDKYDIVAFKHHLRDCIYEEAKVCINLKNDDVDTINKQMDKYKKNNYPANNGLIESGVIVKKHNKKNVQKLMKFWFNEVKNYSKRDQLSFNYSLENNPVKIKWLDYNIFDNDYFIWIRHNAKDFDEKFSVYYDIGKGFNQDDLINYSYEKNKNIKKICFQIPFDSFKIRIDPIEIEGYNCEILSIKNADNIKYENMIKYHDKYLFTNSDPQIIIERSYKKSEQVEILLKLEKNTFEENQFVIKNLLLTNEYLVKELDTCQKRIYEIENSKSWKIIRKISKFIK